MAYSTLADLKKYLDPQQTIELSDDDKDGSADTEVIDEVIAAADADIDMYLSNRYTTPFSTPVPQVVKKLSAKMAIYYLWLRRKEAEVPEKWATEYTNMLELLREIARGEITLGDVASGSVKGDTISTGREASEATFTFENLKNF